MKEIIVTINADGSTQIETRGFKGTACLKETADLEARLGSKTSDVKTREFAATTTTTNTQKARN